MTALPRGGGAELMPVVITIHTLATIVWLGGLFFILAVLVHATKRLDVEARLDVWNRVFSRFIFLSWLGIGAIFASGVGLVFLRFGGYSGVPTVHRFNTPIGILTIVLYAYASLGPWRRFRAALSAGRNTDATIDLNRMLKLVAAVLALGFIASAVSVAGRSYI
jgi:uncharacterized membrane protein